MRTRSAHKMNFEQLCSHSDFASTIITDVHLNRKTFKTKRQFKAMPMITRIQKVTLKAIFESFIRGSISMKHRYEADMGEGVQINAKYRIPSGAKLEGLEMCKVEYSLNLTEREQNYVVDNLFALGPGSYINHCCEPNAELVSNANNMVSVFALKTILPGEEIEVKYSDNYFGDECKCRICV